MDSKWKAGTSGNPAGRPRGSRNRASLISEELEKHGSAVASRVIDAALGGDLQAATLVLQRICPPLRPQAQQVHFSLDTNADINQQAREILDAIAQGLIDPESGRTLLSCLSTVATLSEVVDLNRRLTILEEAL